jgi:cytochrome c5
VCVDAASATLALDGVAVALETVGDAADGAFTRCASIELASFGWHELTIARDAELRTIAVERIPDRPVSFATDVQPRYEASCAGSACHGGGGANVPDLGTHAAWVERADAIRERVVEKQTMPPASVPGWTEDDVAWIERWLDGGMLP